MRGFVARNYSGSLIAVAVLLFVIWNCFWAPSKQKRFERLDRGMPREHVETIMGGEGTPQHFHSSFCGSDTYFREFGPPSTYRWEDAATVVDLTFVNSQVIGIVQSEKRTQMEWVSRVWLPQIAFGFLLFATRLIRAPSLSSDPSPLELDPHFCQKEQCN